VSGKERNKSGTDTFSRLSNTSMRSPKVILDPSLRSSAGPFKIVTALMGRLNVNKPISSRRPVRFRRSGTVLGDKWRSGSNGVRSERAVVIVIVSDSSFGHCSKTDKNFNTCCSKRFSNERTTRRGNGARPNAAKRGPISPESSTCSGCKDAGDTIRRESRVASGSVRYPRPLPICPAGLPFKTVAVLVPQPPFSGSEQLGGYVGRAKRNDEFGGR
jgi:hypothetical protein